MWFSELTHFWDVAEAAGYAMDIASPAGGRIPIDPESLMISEMATAFGLEGAVSKHYGDRTYMDRLEHTIRVADVEVADYAAVYVVPFSLEERLRTVGADYRKAVIPFVSYVVEDGRLITGENPGSAHAAGEAVVKRLQPDGGRALDRPTTGGTT